MRHATTILRGIGALIASLVFAIAVPAGLVSYVGWPLPATLPSIDQIQLALRSGISLRAVHKQLRGISSDRAVGFGPNKVLSSPDAIAQVIEKYLEERKAAIADEERGERRQLDQVVGAGDERRDGGCRHPTAAGRRWWPDHRDRVGYRPSGQSAAGCLCRLEGGRLGVPAPGRPQVVALGDRRGESGDRAGRRTPRRPGPRGQVRRGVLPLIDRVGDEVDELLETALELPARALQRHLHIVEPAAVGLGLVVVGDPAWRPSWRARSWPWPRTHAPSCAAASCSPPTRSGSRSPSS